MTELDFCRKELLVAITQELRLRCLAFRKSGRRFAIKTATGSGILYMHYIPHPGIDFDADLSVSVRLDAVEDIVNEFHGRLPKNEWRRTATFGSRLDSLMGLRDLKRWTISCRSDIPPAVADMGDKIEEYLIPYIQEYSDAHRAYQVLSHPNDGLAELHCPIRQKRAYGTVALAAVLGKRDEIDALISRFRTYLLAVPGIEIAKFDRFAEQMKKRAIGHDSVTT